MRLWPAVQGQRCMHGAASYATRQKLGRPQLSGGTLLPRSIATTLTAYSCRDAAALPQENKGRFLTLACGLVVPRTEKAPKGAPPPDPSDRIERSQQLTPAMAREVKNSRWDEILLTDSYSLTRAAQNGSRQNHLTFPSTNPR